MTECDNWLKCLPDLVIENILNCVPISIYDIYAVKLLRNRFDNSDYDIWERIILRRWSDAKNYYDAQYERHEAVEDAERERDLQIERNVFFIRKGINYALQLQDYVSRIIRMHYSKDKDYYDIDNLTQFKEVFSLDEDATTWFDNMFIENNDIINKYNIQYYFIMPVIKHLVEHPPRFHCDLTKRYVHEKIFYYMKKCSYIKELDKFKALPEEDQLLEKVATIIAQSIKPKNDVFYADVQTSLDNLALEIRNYFRRERPDDLFSTLDDEIVTSWRNKNIDQDHWNHWEGMQIMDALFIYMFERAGFEAWVDLFNYMCIDNVLTSKRGEDIIILIIYQSVARRLGLRCDIIKMNNKYCIYWDPLDDLINDNGRIFFMEDRRAILNAEDVILSHDGPYIMGTREVLDVIKFRLMHADFYAILSSTFLETDSNDYEGRVFKLRLTTPVRRNTKKRDPKYAVGMFVRYLLSLTGVIIAWHRLSDTPIIPRCEEYVLCAMKVNYCIDPYAFSKIQEGFTAEIYYVILNENNQMCYVFEDKIIEIISSENVKKIMSIKNGNTEIGRYFCKFVDTHYEPNEMLAYLFPDDAAIRRQQYQNYEEDMQVRAVLEARKNI